MNSIVAWAKKESIVVGVVALYAIAFALAPEKALSALVSSARTAFSISLIILSVFSLLGLFSVLIDKQAVGRRLGERTGLGTLLMAAGFGTVLVGPVYAIFPLLKAFRDHGARWAVIVTIMTSWAVKLPMIPLEMRFLGWQFSLARSAFTIVASLGMGLLVERLMGTAERLPEPALEASVPEPSTEAA